MHPDWIQVKIMEENMNYAKPELVLNVNASEVIKGSSDKTSGMSLDANNVTRDATFPAYEADE